MKRITEAFCIGYGFCWGVVIAAGMAIGIGRALDRIVGHLLP